MTVPRLRKKSVIFNNTLLVMSIFGNNQSMTKNFAGDTHIDNLLKMTNDVMTKLKKEVS
jgi:hypothetical protein